VPELCAGKTGFRWNIVIFTVRAASAVLSIALIVGWSRTSKDSIAIRLDLADAEFEIHANNPGHNAAQRRKKITKSIQYIPSRVRFFQTTKQTLRPRKKT